MKNMKRERAKACDGTRLEAVLFFGLGGAGRAAVQGTGAAARRPQLTTLPKHLHRCLSTHPLQTTHGNTPVRQDPQDI